MTVHQFRHGAGAIILKNRPGEFELVRQILGHRSIATTMRCYVGLETIQASEIFTNMVVAEINQSLLGEDHDQAGDARLRKQHTYRSLPVAEWPQADRRVWEEACRPALRLEPGGRASTSQRQA